MLRVVSTAPCGALRTRLATAVGGAASTGVVGETSVATRAVCVGATGYPALAASPAPALHLRALSTEAQSAAAAEAALEDKLKSELDASYVKVEDISGGCGSMYAAVVVSPQFDGLRTIKQQQLVYKAIADEISDMHGLRLQTFTEDKWARMQE